MAMALYTCAVSQKTSHLRLPTILTLYDQIIGTIQYFLAEVLLRKYEIIYDAFFSHLTYLVLLLYLVK